MQTSPLRKRMPVTALTDPKIIVPAIGVAFAKLSPRVMIKNPVMFVVEVVATLTTVLFVRDLMTGGADLGFTFQIILWLWFTILFANFAEAVAEGRGKAQAATLRQTREETDSQAYRRRDDGPDGSDARRRARARADRAGRGRRPHSLRRRGDRGRRLGQRSGDHRRIRAGHPRGRRRSLGRHRRHARASRTGSRCASRAEPGDDFPRPHDQVGRRRRAAEDAERDRAERPAGRLDDDLSDRGGDHPAASRSVLRGGSIPIVVLVALLVCSDPHDHRRDCSRPSASPAWTA